MAKGDGGDISILWLTPDKPEDISVGRKRISRHLEKKDIGVTIKGTTIKTILKSTYKIRDYDVLIGTTRSGAIAGTLLNFIHSGIFLVDHIDPIRQFRTNNNRYLSFIVEWLENLSFYLSDHIFYVYNEEEKRVNKFSSCSTEVSLGVDYELFADPKQKTISIVKSDLKNKGIDIEKHNIAIYIGGLEPIYHIKELLESTEYLGDKWRLLILGTGSLDEYVEEVSEKKQKIEFLGTVPHEKISGYLYISDVGISLVDDPNTLKILEYSAAGLPTVQLKGRAENTRFKELLEFCSPKPSSIADAIRKAGKLEKEKRDKLKKIVSFYDWEKITDKYLSVIRSKL